jgi:hypothetical protein
LLVVEIIDSDETDRLEFERRNLGRKDFRAASEVDEGVDGQSSGDIAEFWESVANETDVCVFDCEEDAVISAIVEAVFKVRICSWASSLLLSLLNLCICLDLKTGGGTDDVRWLRLLFDIDGGTEDDLTLLEELAPRLAFLLPVFDFLDPTDVDMDDEVNEYLEIVGAVDIVLSD